MAVPATDSYSPLNTVAVVPYDLPASASSASRSRAALDASARSAGSLVSAASNLIGAIAQGTTSLQTVQSETLSDDAESDDGSSSFTYRAPAGTSSGSQGGGWYASTPYHISNRYYEVDITLKATRSALASASETSSAAEDSVLSQPFPAYLVVVDRSRSLDHHRQLAASLESKVSSGFDADISIVVGVSLLSSSHPQLVQNLDDEPRHASATLRRASNEIAKTSDLVAVYADAGWEFIAIDEADADGSDAQSSRGHGSDGEDSEEGGDGIERIREALMNHMWNGLVRKQEATSALRGSLPEGSHSSVASAPLSSIGFSEDATAWRDNQHDLLEQAPRLDSAVEAASREESSQEGRLPSLGVGTHAETSELDEQLANLFLSSSRPSDLAELEAFLASEDPSWPTASSSSAPVPAAPAFDDDFDDFLPFQSAGSSDAWTAFEGADLPSEREVANMQNVLFGSQTGSADEGDLVSQLNQLQYHAQRVRGIDDPDQRRKQAALVALAFSMQWSDSEPRQAQPDGSDGLAF
ncbi:hypothetical protein PaG_03258 [Moesziomyces aphidis]|uniref:Uncharacterized protein n=1 Tax=Moesziomyces aphidis TaxID=84754 RepID=W3VLT1_MOEAP|nr:hypothetical protein PaG_03258 [Moesziomyces aphidis]